MRKFTKSVAYDMDIKPISIFTAIRLMLTGKHVGIVYGHKHGKGIRAKMRFF
jgi:hypothetical protein